MEKSSVRGSYLGRVYSGLKMQGCLRTSGPCDTYKLVGLFLKDGPSFGSNDDRPTRRESLRC
jgi:hypothetical protein